MRFDEVRKRYFAAPFRPFDIVLTNGRSVPVRHPEFMALSPDGRSVTVYEEDGALIIDVPLIVAWKERANSARKRKR
jgi:virulence-associated protein VagC